MDGKNVCVVSAVDRMIQTDVNVFWLVVTLRKSADLPERIQPIRVMPVPKIMKSKVPSGTTNNRQSF